LPDLGLFPFFLLNFAAKKAADFLIFLLEIGFKPCMNFIYTLLSSVNNSIFNIFVQDLLERLLANRQGYGRT